MKLKRVTKNRYLDALLKLMLFSAIIHMILLIIYSIIKLEIKMLNYLDIVQVYLLFPVIKNNNLTFIIGTAIAVIIYTFFFLNSKKIK